MKDETVHRKIRDLRQRLEQVLPRDRQTIGAGIRRFERQIGESPSTHRRDEEICLFDAQIRAAITRRESRIAGRPVLIYPETLPIVAYKDEIVQTIKNHCVVVISGETGSGKTTQIPKFCLEAGRGIDGMIGCTQPRRIAAISVAHRIAEEMGDFDGKAVGYQVRFQDRTPENAYIKVMTDGILLAESQRDRLFYRYDTLIVDEAHERSLNIDFILGLLHRITERRKDLKVVITSATIDTDKFSKAFGGAPIIEVSGRLYPVTLEYRPPVEEAAEEQDTQGDVPSHVSQAVEAVMEIHQKSGSGDILVFMPTEQDIRETCALLEKRIPKRAVVLPLFARLSADRQSRVFETMSWRKIIVATNIAETSLTIAGIRFVVDTGLARISRYVPRSRTTTLPVSPISRASADQRKGRCGRVANGTCIRLYSEADYLSRPEFTPPEIQRANLADVILRMVALGMGDAADFPFIDPPDPKAVRDGYDILFELGALCRPDTSTHRKRAGIFSARLTETGRVMARFPLDPRLTRILIESVREGCVEEISILVAALSIPDPRERPMDQAEKADQAHREFLDPLSDFITLLNIWKKFHDGGGPGRGMGRLKKFCRAHFLSFRRMWEWRDIHEQILMMIEESDLRAIGKADALPRSAPAPFPERYGAIHRAILSGFLSNIALRKEKNMFIATRSRSVMIFPGSGLFNRAGQWIVAAEMVETSRPFARTVAAIDPRWLEPLGGELCRYHYFDPRWDEKRGEVVVTQQVSLFGLVIVTGRAVAFGRVDPEAATEIFIRSALVEGELDRPCGFIKHNRNLVDEIRRMEDKLRRRDLLVSGEALVAFYRERLKGVFDIRTLKRRIRENGDEFLRMTQADLLQKDPDLCELSLFPDQMAISGRRLDCHYTFSPGTAADGVTVRIPGAVTSEIPDGALEWLVPGLLKEKIAALLKALPKSLRKRLVPIHQTAEIIEREMPRGQGSLTGALGEFIHRRFGVSVTSDAWAVGDLPEHLRTRIAITDATGKEVGASRDPRILKRGTSGQSIDPEAFRKARAQWERESVRSWDFGDLPESVEIEGKHQEKWLAFPGLCAQDPRSVRLKLFADRQTAVSSHLEGVRALYAERFAKDFIFLRRSLSAANPVPKKSGLFGGEKAFLDRMVRSVENRLFAVNLRTQQDFEAHGRENGPRILSSGADLVAAVSPVVSAYAELSRTFRDVEQKFGPHHPLAQLSRTLIKDVEELLPPDFLESHELVRYPHIVRYIRAAALRFERAAVDIEKDRSKARRVEPFALWRRTRQGPREEASFARKNALEEFFWMLEEFKVSVFAQELGTATPVSEKRLKQKMAQIDRMA